MRRRMCMFLALVQILSFGLPACATLDQQSTTEPITEPTTEPIPMDDLICVVQVFDALAGINPDLGLQRYEYYAILEKGVEPLDEEMARAIDPKLVDTDRREQGTIFGNEGTNRWYTRLIYAPQVENFHSEQFRYRNIPWLPTEWGEHIRIYYSCWDAGKTDLRITPDVEAAMRQSAYGLFTKDLEIYDIGNEEVCMLLGFMTVSNDGRILVEVQSQGLYLPMPDGSLQLLIELPHSMNTVSYFWFPPQ